MSPLTAVLLAIFSVGGAAALTALFRGTDLWRSGTQRTEARAIQNLERYRKAADRRAAIAERRSSYLQDLVDFWRGRSADLTYLIRTNWGEEHVPTLGPIPEAPKELPESAEDTKLLGEAKNDE